MDIQKYIQIGLNYLGPIWPFIIVLLIGLYVFWSDAQITKKNRNSIFDMYTLCMLVMVVWGRIMYIFSNISDFTDLPWSLSPYERYQDGVFFFRLLPWKYFDFWHSDGLELQLFPMFVSFVVFAILYAVFLKRWRWREIMGTIFSSSSMAFSFILIISGIFAQADQIYRIGLGVLIINSVYQLILIALARLKISNQTTREHIYYNITLLFTALIVVVITTTISSLAISTTDRIHIYTYGVIGLLSVIFYLIDMNRGTVVIEQIGKQRLPNITPNSPVKFPIKQG